MPENWFTVSEMLILVFGLSMLKVLAIFENTQFEARVQRYFQNHQVRFLRCQRKYSSFLRMVQYAPHVILLQTISDIDEKLHLVQLMKKSKVADYIPIIVIGPRIIQEEKNEILKKGIDDYLLNTIDLIELSQIVLKLAKQALNQRRKDLGIYINQISRSDEKILTDASIPSEKKLDIMESHISNLVAFPATIMRVLHDDADVLSSASSLSQIIETDAAIATELLKLANSAFYNSTGKGVSTLRDALVRVGTTQTKSVVMSMAVLGSMKSVNYETGFSHTEFWSHSVAVASIAQYMARKSAICNEDEAFLFGLIHEMGVLLYNEYLNDFFLLCLDKSTEMGFPFTFFQKSVLQITHNDLMIRLCQRWNFPQKFKKVYQIIDIGVITEETAKRAPLATLLMIADTIAHSLNTGRAADSCVWEVPRVVCKELRCEFIYEKEFTSDIFTKINMYNQTLSIDKMKYPHKTPTMDGNDEVTVICLDNPQLVWSPISTYLHWEGYDLITVTTKEDFLKELESNKGAIFTIVTYMEHDFTLLDSLLKKGFHGLIFDDTHLIKENYEKSGIIVTSYPVDLRNIDLILHFLHLGRFGKVHHLTGRLGTLLPLRSDKRNALLVHPSKSFQETFKTYLDDIVDNIEFANDGEKAIRKAKIAEDDIDWFFINQELTVTDSFDVIVGIKKLCHHKRGKFVLLYNRKKPSNLEMARYRQVGVRRFIDISNPETIFDNLKMIMGIPQN